MWAYDFVFDACANGQQLKCLTVIDELTRESLAIHVAGSIRSTRVIEVLAKLISVHGAPKYLRSDNGSEFLSRAILRWLAHQNIETALIDPGKSGHRLSHHLLNSVMLTALGLGYFSLDFWYSPISFRYGPITQALL